MNFNESGNETVLISSCASYLKIEIMITRGVSSLDVLILVNLDYLGSNALNKHYSSLLIVSDEVLQWKFASYSFIFHLQSFQILSKIFYIIIDTCVRFYTNAELYKTFLWEFQIIVLRDYESRVGFQWRPLGLRPSRRLTSRFEGIENVKKNFDVEKWYNFNFLFCRKALSEHALRKTQKKMISVYDYKV